MTRLALSLAAAVLAFAATPASAQHHGHQRQHHHVQHRPHVQYHRPVVVQHHQGHRPSHHGHGYHRPVIVHTPPVHTQPVYAKPTYAKPTTLERFCVEVSKDGYGRVHRKKIECKIDEPKVVAVKPPPSAAPAPSGEETPQN